MAAASSHPRPRVSAMVFSSRSFEKEAVEALVMFPCKAVREKKGRGLTSPLCRASLKQVLMGVTSSLRLWLSKAVWEMPSDCVYWQA